MNELEDETAIDIEKRVAKLLHELGVAEPPIDLKDVASFLHVDHGYYNLADPWPPRRKRCSSAGVPAYLSAE
jgi:hypothetical protein